MYVPLSEVNESSCWSRRSSIDMNDICITIVLTILSCKIHRLNEMKIKESFSFLCFCSWSMCTHIMLLAHLVGRAILAVGTLFPSPHVNTSETTRPNGKKFYRNVPLGDLIRICYFSANPTNISIFLKIQRTDWC